MKILGFFSKYFSQHIIKSPRYTGGDFLFLYAAAAAAADSCPRDNFWTSFWISFIFGMIVGPDL